MNKEELLLKIKKETIIYRNIPDEFKDDQDVLAYFVAYRSDYSCLSKIDKNIKGYGDRIKMINLENRNSFEHINKKALDKENIKLMLKKSPGNFRYFPEKWKDDLELVIDAVSVSTSNMEYVSKRLSNNLDVLKAALNKSIFFLNKISDEDLKNSELRKYILETFEEKILTEACSKKFATINLLEREEALLNKISNIEKNEPMEKKRLKI